MLMQVMVMDGSDGNADGDSDDGDDGDDEDDRVRVSSSFLSASSSSSLNHSFSSWPGSKI